MILIRKSPEAETPPLYLPLIQASYSCQSYSCLRPTFNQWQCNPSEGKPAKNMRFVKAARAFSLCQASFRLTRDRQSRLHLHQSSSAVLYCFSVAVAEVSISLILTLKLEARKIIPGLEMCSRTRASADVGWPLQWHVRPNHTCHYISLSITLTRSFLLDYSMNLFTLTCLRPYSYFSPKDRRID